MEEVGRKLYLSETPSIGWEAKTLGAKRRISSSEIATVPGTLDLVELLFSAVLMLVGWLARYANDAGNFVLVVQAALRPTA
jgi:hypothetical protein